MSVFVLLTLLYLYDLPAECKEDAKPRSVNLALETILEFDNYENSADVQIIDKVKNFLDRIKSAIDRNKSARRSINKDIRFTDFVERALNILSKYADDDLQDVLAVIDSEIRKYHYKGCKFYELVQNEHVRRYMAGKLNTIKDAPADKIRNTLKTISMAIEADLLDSKKKDVLNYISSLYLEESGPKFKKFLDNLALYKSKTKRANLDLVRIIRNGLRTIFFDHYSGLDYKKRKTLKMKLETMWRDYFYPDAGEYHSRQIKPLNEIKKAPKKDINKDIYKEEVSPEGMEEDVTTEKRKISKKTKVRQNKQRIKNIDDRLSSVKGVIRVNVVENNKTDDIQVPADVKKESSSDIEGPKTSRRAKYSFITLYPEAITLMRLRKSKKTTKTPRKHKSRSKKHHDRILAARKEMKELAAEKHDEDTKTAELDKKENSEDMEEEIKKIITDQQMVKTVKDELKKKAKKNKALRNKEEPKAEADKQHKHGVKNVEVKRENKKRFVIKKGGRDSEYKKNNQEKNKGDTKKSVDVTESAEMIEKSDDKGLIKTELENIALEINVKNKKQTLLDRERDMLTTAKMLLRNKDTRNRAFIHRVHAPQRKFQPYRSASYFDDAARNYKLRYPRIKDSRKYLEAANEYDSNEGMPIEVSMKSRSYRKNFANNTSTTKSDNTSVTSDVIERINNLEQELMNVKAEIENRPDLLDIPTYDTLNFWQGTTKLVNATNSTAKTTKSTITTAKPTTTIKTTKSPTTTTTLPPKTTTEQETLHTTNSTYQPVFRSRKTSNISLEDVKDIEQGSEEMKPTNDTENVHNLNANNDVYNVTINLDEELNDVGAEIDTLDNYKMANISSHIISLENYLNNTKYDPNDKTYVVRKKMYEELKHIITQPPENRGNDTEKLMSDKEFGNSGMKGTDPLELTDDIMEPLK